MPDLGAARQIKTAESTTNVQLSQLARGAKAIVPRTALDALGLRERSLLEAMGFAESCCVRVCRAGSPCIVQIDQTRLGLALEVAERIMVTPLTD